MNSAIWRSVFVQICANFHRVSMHREVIFENPSLCIFHPLEEINTCTPQTKKKTHFGMILLKEYIQWWMSTRKYTRRTQWFSTYRIITGILTGPELITVHTVGKLTSKWENVGFEWGDRTCPFGDINCLCGYKFVRRSTECGQWLKAWPMAKTELLSASFWYSNIQSSSDSLEILPRMHFPFRWAQHTHS